MFTFSSSPPSFLCLMSNKAYYHPYLVKIKSVTKRTRNFIPWNFESNYRDHFRARGLPREKVARLCFLPPKIECLI